MAWCLLKLNGEVVVRTTLRSLIEEEVSSAQEQGRRILYDTSVKQIIGDSITDEDLPQSITPTYKPFYHWTSSPSLKPPLLLGFLCVCPGYHLINRRNYL